MALAHALPFGTEVLACALTGAYARLVVTEYAAWARANLEVSLERAMAFGKFGPPALLFMLVWYVGLTVLPTYFRYFEKPSSSDSPA